MEWIIKKSKKTIELLKTDQSGLDLNMFWPAPAYLTFNILPRLVHLNFDPLHTTNSGSFNDVMVQWFYKAVPVHSISGNKMGMFNYV